MPTITPAEAAYLAGFIDADGHIGIVRRTRRSTRQDYVYLRPIIQIGQAKRGILDWIASVVGEGAVNIHRQRGFYNLRFHAGTIRWLLPQIAPYLIVKRRQAELVLEFTELSAVWKNGRALSDEEKARREALRFECEQLNLKPAEVLRREIRAVK